jgi:hypothetical protein
MKKEKRILPSALADGLTDGRLFLPPLTKGGSRGVNDSAVTAVTDVTDVTNVTTLQPYSRYDVIFNQAPGTRHQVLFLINN